MIDMSGAICDVLPVSGVNPTNVCFGGPDHRNLYVTVEDTSEICVFEMPVSGARLNFCPSGSDATRWSDVLTRNDGL